MGMPEPIDRTVEDGGITVTNNISHLTVIISPSLTARFDCTDIPTSRDANPYLAIWATNIPPSSTARFDCTDIPTSRDVGYKYGTDVVG